MAARKRTTSARRSAPPPSGPVVPIGVIQDGRVAHAIAHAARIRQRLEADPRHKDRALFQDALEGYRALIASAGPDALERAARKVRDELPADLSPAMLSAAVTYLEG